MRALVLAPTRELAAQIDENIRAYCAQTELNTVLIFGGVNIRPQTEALLKGCDFLIATPGRLLDHAGQLNVDLSEVEFLILDEADRMLDMGFIHDIRRIVKLLPAKRQTLMFSATFSAEIRELADSYLNNPVSVEIAKNKESTLISQEAWSIAKKRKRELLRDLIVDNQWDQVLVFTRMKHTANRLASQLEKDGIVAAAIHGNKSQSARTKALAGFKDKSIRVLVATDIAARGLDIEGLPHVINYELPNVAEDYVHRIGRTGRAGVPGHAVSLVSDDEKDLLSAIEKLLKKRIDLKKAEGYEGEPPADIVADEKERDAARKRELENCETPAASSAKKNPPKPKLPRKCTKPSSSKHRPPDYLTIPTNASKRKFAANRGKRRLRCSNRKSPRVVVRVANRILTSVETTVRPHRIPNAPTSATSSVRLVPHVGALRAMIVVLRAPRGSRPIPLLRKIRQFSCPKRCPATSVHTSATKLLARTTVVILKATDSVRNVVAAMPRISSQQCSARRKRPIRTRDLSR